MRGGALALGLIGGVIGLIAAGIALAVGGIGGALNTGAPATGQADFSLVVAGGWIALGSSVVGIVGAALVMGKPRMAGLIMLLAAIGGFIGISLFYVVAGPLLLVGALLAFLGRKPKPLAVIVQPSVSPDGRYWWDGVAWKPMPSASESSLPPLPPPT